MPSRRSQVKLTLYAAVFAVAGAYLTLTGEGAERAIGVLAVVFAVWALVAFRQRFRTHASIVLSPAGLRLPLGGEIRWEDLADVGLVEYKRTTLVGLRLRSTERFIGSFTDEERAALARNAKRLRIFSRTRGCATGDVRCWRSRQLRRRDRRGPQVAERARRRRIPLDSGRDDRLRA